MFVVLTSFFFGFCSRWGSSRSNLDQPSGRLHSHAD